MRVRLSVAVAFLATVVLAAGAHAAAVVAIFTVAGSDAQGFAGDGGPATSARLDGPEGVVALRTGGMLVADTINQRIRRIDANGRIATVAGNGTRGFSGDGGPARAASFQDPTAIDVGPDGSVYVADTGNSRIRVIRPDATISTLAGTADEGFSGDGGPAKAAQVNAPAGLVVDKSGQLFFSDSGNNRVRVIHTDGTIDTVAGTGQPGAAGDGGPAKAAQLNTPAGLAVAGDGSLLIADAGNGRVRRVAPDGTIATVATQLKLPVDVAAVPQGGFFVVDQTGNRVMHVDAGGRMTRLAGTGDPRYGGDGKPAVGSYLNGPHAVELLPSNFELVVADSDNNRVRYVAIPGQSTLFGLAAQKPSITAPLVKRSVKAGKRNHRIKLVKDVPIGFELTKPARLKLSLSTKRGRAVTSFRASLGAGPGAVHLPPRLRAGKHRLTKDHYVVRVTATAGSAIATARLELVVK